MIFPWLSDIFTLANTLTVLQTYRPAFLVPNSFLFISLIPGALESLLSILIPETSLFPETHLNYSVPRNTLLFPGTLQLTVDQILVLESNSPSKKESCKIWTQGLSLCIPCLNQLS